MIENEEIEIDLPEEAKNFRMYSSGRIGNEKLFFKFKEGYHLTFHTGQHSKEFDIHLTRERDNRHVTYFRLKYSEMEKLTNIMNDFMIFGLHVYYTTTPISVGKLIRHHCVLKKVYDLDSYKMFVNEKKNGRHFKVSLAQKINIKSLKTLYLDPEDIYDTTCEMFEVFRYKSGVLKKQGYLHKVNEGPRAGKLFFISKKNWTLLNALMDWGTLQSLGRVQFDRKKGILEKTLKSLNEKYKGTRVLKRLRHDLEKHTRPNKKLIKNESRRIIKNRIH